MGTETSSLCIAPTHGQMPSKITCLAGPVWCDLLLKCLPTERRKKFLWRKKKIPAKKIKPFCAVQGYWQLSTIQSFLFFVFVRFKKKSMLQ